MRLWDETSNEHEEIKRKTRISLRLKADKKKEKETKKIISKNYYMSMVKERREG